MVRRDLFHLALREDWERAEATGTYTGSTIGRSLADEGFVHCSFADQVSAVAQRYYRGRGDVVLLEIDPALLDCEVRVEAVGAATEEYPHVYGPVPVSAVVNVESLAIEDGGRLRLPAKLA